MSLRILLIVTGMTQSPFPVNHCPKISLYFQSHYTNLGFYILKSDVCIISSLISVLYKSCFCLDHSNSNFSLLMVWPSSKPWEGFDISPHSPYFFKSLHQLLSTWLSNLTMPPNLFQILLASKTNFNLPNSRIVSLKLNITFYRIFYQFQRPQL